MPNGAPATIDISIKLTSAVWKHSKQKSGALLVLLALADYANEDGIAWPAVSTLARKARMSSRNVQRWLSTLQRDGELKVLRNQGRRGVNIYQISVPQADLEKGDARSTGDIRGVPKGNDIDFWINVSFRCFEQPVHPVPAHVLRALSFAIPTLDKTLADSLVDFYQSEPLRSKQPPYSSRRHSPERLMLDLPRQLALAAQI